MRQSLLVCAAIATLVLTSCGTLIPPSATSSGPRTIVLGGDEVFGDQALTEEDVGGFISWYCKDFIDGGRILVEVGYFGDPSLEGTGFILYDGGYSGEATRYRRDGLNHRWDWGEDLDYAFMIKPDGTGLYYDFSAVLPGEQTTADEVYKCYPRRPPRSPR